MLEIVTKMNYILFQEINAPAGTHPLLDTFMVFCANSLIFLFPLVLLMTWGRPLSWRKYVIYQGEEELLQERRAVVLWAGVACLVAYSVNLLIEQFVFEPRPFVSHHVHLLVSHAADSSFPSDHTAWACAVVGMLLFPLLPRIYQRQRQVRWSHTLPLLVLCLLLVLATVAAMCIGIARIYVGVHYPGDILGGAIDGLLAAFLVTLLRWWLRQPTNAVLRLAQRLHIA